MTVIVPFCTEGHMTQADVIKECGVEGWIPLLVFDHEGHTTMPVFTDQRVCYRFLKRNLPKDWITGGVALSQGDLKSLAERDWRVLELSWPRVIKDIVDFRIEVHQFAGDFEVIK